MSEYYVQVNMFSQIRSHEKHIEAIGRDEATPFIEQIHYSRQLPNNVVYSFGLFEEGEMVGCVTYGVPASPSLCKGLAGEENKDKVLELNRLAIKPECNGDNRASYLVGNSLKMLPNETYVVSYADTGWTHVGYVYQATNFYYTGLSEKRVDRYSHGKHSRCYQKGETETRYQTRNQKHRYIYLVGDKRTKKQMLKNLRYPIYDKYPKGDEVRYDTNNPQMAIPIRIIEGKQHDK